MNWFKDQDNQRLLLLGAALGLLVSGTVLAFMDQIAAASTVYAVTCMVLIFFFLSRFKRFKGFGIEAELWEQQMEQAEKLRHTLRFLSETFGEMMYMQFGPGSRWAGIPDKVKIDFIEKMDRHLQDTGLTQDEIDQKKNPWHKCVMRDLVEPIAERFKDSLQEKLNERIQALNALGTITSENRGEQTRLLEERNSISKPISEMNDLIWRDDWPSVPSLLRKAIDSSSWLTTGERETLYEDYREQFIDIDHYVNHRALRRP